MINAEGSIHFKDFYFDSTG